MKKRYYLLLGLILAAVCFGYIAVRGSVYTMKVNTIGMGDVIGVYLEKGEEIVRITDQRREGDTLYITLQSVSQGKDSIRIEGTNISHGEVIYVHIYGIITINTFFGYFNGGIIIPIVLSVYLAVILWGIIKAYRHSMAESMYQYRNILMLSLIIFISPLIFDLLISMARYTSLDYSIRSLLGFFSEFAVFALPVAFVVSVIVTISNIQLMRKEGRTWTNMLGCILGIILCMSTILPLLIEYYLQWKSIIIDVHNQNSPVGYILDGIKIVIMTGVGYMECILLASIILSIKAARYVPAFNKDYIMILGCQVRDDGTVTPLLKGRADRALEFTRMQKEKTGKDIVFVPSGGKGDDEKIAEAQAVRNYLVSTGIDDSRIVVEDKSMNTRENFSNSFTMIKEHSDQEDPKIAFSTTNYHVFRSGILAKQQGIDAEGIGSPTKSYFWINAFVREFIATVLYGWKTHLTVIFISIIACAIMQCIMFISNNL